MTKVIFYEKPGCVVNQNQKNLVEAAGFDVEIYDLMAQKWTAAGLRAYFGDRPVEDWFDPEAPRIRSGEVNPASANPQAALVMMTVDPTLIKSPLVKLEDRCASGLDESQLEIFIKGARDADSLWTTRPPAFWGHD